MKKNAKSTIFVCEYGWIICGVIKSENEAEVTLADSSVVRRWGNGKGIGALAKEENKSEYTLDAIGGVTIKKSKVLFQIPCEW